MSLGAEVRKRRTAQKLTLEGLSERSGLTPHYLSTLETGKRDPSVSTLLKLARALGVPPGDLLEAPRAVSSHALTVGRLFDAAPSEVQQGVFMILRAWGQAREGGGVVAAKRVMKGATTAVTARSAPEGATTAVKVAATAKSAKDATPTVKGRRKKKSS
jgi:transcriptional regulator with XRE-family HTH domain